MWNPNQDADFHSLVTAAPKALGPTRRGALQAAVGLGYAAATLPTLAQTAIQTSTQGLIAGRVTIDSQGFALPAYRAAPAVQHNLPVVLVLSEIFGVHAYIADVCHRLAQAGYLAIAPELFVRQGDAKNYTDIPRLMSEVIAKVPDAQVMADLDAAFNWAGGNGGHLRRAGVTGFCWGGRQAWLYNAHNPLIRASVAWYGRLEGVPGALTPKQPLEVVNDLHGPVLGLYGGADTGISQDSVARMQAALATGGPAARRSQFVVYPDAPHAFHADYRPSYRAQAAQDGWTRCLDWLKRNGVA
jgi:carboxymethylenebutenolidase